MTTPTLKFTKKPVTIEAFQLPTPPADGTTNEAHENAVWAFLGWCSKVGFEPVPASEDGSVVIATLEGLMTASPGDWIVKGVKGEFYPCKPDIFEASYLPALAAQSELPEPVFWQYRSRPTWDGAPDWDSWEQCSHESAADYQRTQKLHDWEYETRALYTAAQLQQAAEQAQVKREPMTQEQMREIFLANGFTIKEGQDDLKDYVYAAGRAIEAHHGIGGDR